MNSSCLVSVTQSTGLDYMPLPVLELKFGHGRNFVFQYHKLARTFSFSFEGEEQKSFDCYDIGGSPPSGLVTLMH